MYLIGKTGCTNKKNSIQKLGTFTVEISAVMQGYWSTVFSQKLKLHDCFIIYFTSTPAQKYSDYCSNINR